MSNTPNEVNIQNPILYRDYSRIIIRDWCSLLTGNEMAVVMFIFDRTIGWGKEAEFISYAQFTDGIYGADGRCYNKGLNQSRASVVRMVKALLDDGFITAMSGRSGENKLALVFDRAPRKSDKFRTSKKEKPKSKGSRLPTSKRGVTDSPNAQIYHAQSEQTHAQFAEKGAQFDTPKRRIEEREREEDKSNRRPTVLDRPAASGVLFDSVLSQPQKRKEGKFDALLRSSNPSGDDLALIFHAAWKDHFSAAPYVQPKGKDIIALRSYYLRWKKIPRSGPFAPFFQWCIVSWRMILSESFRWMTDAPELPSVMFLIKFSEKFEAAYSRRDELSARINMSFRDRRILDLVNKGMDPELARIEIDGQAPPPRLPRLTMPQRERRVVQHSAQPTYTPPTPMRILEVHETDWSRFKL